MEKPANLPKPGQAVRGSRSGQPIMVLFDLLGRRWALGIIWNLSGGACTFRELQNRCDTLSPTVLNTRIKELRATGIVENTDQGYALTENGQRLFAHLAPLGSWAEEWAKEL